MVNTEWYKKRGLTPIALRMQEGTIEQFDNFGHEHRLTHSEIMINALNLYFKNKSKYKTGGKKDGPVA